ncbi:MAG: hypothetical protein WD646_12975 [Actinomycetota bacterium]
MSNSVDLLLAQAREPEPLDDGFVARVMRDIEQLPEPRSRLIALRRPLFAATVAAVVLTGGAVAALVGTQVLRPDPDDGSGGSPRSSVSVTSQPRASDPNVSGTRSESTPAASQEARSAIEGTRHTISVVDPTTGLLLETDTYTNVFTTGVPHRVTLRIKNTNRAPLAITGYRNCFLQAMAFPMSSSSPDQTPEEYYAEHRNQSGIEWECAGSDGDAREPKSGTETFVLQPGAQRTADAMIALPAAGSWGVMGVCRCDVADSSAPMAPSDPLDDLKKRVLPSPLIDIGLDPDAGLLTPPIGVRAKPE